MLLQRFKTVLVLLVICTAAISSGEQAYAAAPNLPPGGACGNQFCVSSPVGQTNLSSSTFPTFQWTTGSGGPYTFCLLQGDYDSAIDIGGSGCTTSGGSSFPTVVCQDQIKIAVTSYADEDGICPQLSPDTTYLWFLRDAGGGGTIAGGDNQKQNIGFFYTGAGNVTSTEGSVSIQSPFGSADTNAIIKAVINRGSTIFLFAVGVVMVGLIAYAGVLYIIDSGNEENTKKAKKILTAAVVGLFIISIVGVILKAIESILGINLGL